MQQNNVYKIIGIFLRRKILFIFFCCNFSAIKSQDIFGTLALSVADNTGYGYYTFQKPGIYFAIGKSQEVERLREGRFNYGLAFSQKGARKAQNPANNDFVEYNLRLNYAEANIMFWLKMKSLKALIGLNSGYLFNYTEKSVNGITITTPTQPFKKLDFSLTGGGGVMLGKSVLLQLTASYSILPVRNIGGIGTVAFSRGPRNTLVNIGFTYLFIKKPQPEEIPAEE